MKNRKRIIAIIALVFCSAFIIGGLTIQSIEIIVSPEMPDLKITTSPFNTLEVVLMESEGKITITGLKKDTLWLGYIKGISMFPTMRTDGAAVIVEKVDIDFIEVGDILVFRNPFTNEWVGHRVTIIGYDDYGWYAETMADNPNTPLGQSPMGHKVRKEGILGKVRIYLDY